ncbi:MAG TPA: cytochrome C oxidase subunit IV family protein [Brumimicrobium sp.]|nr:cytochrome C oxidase subunit IV family protein [Brumimicrobium sp.]
MEEERDDIIEYSKYTHHTEEEGKLKRKKIWQVTLLLSIVTAVEVGLGLYVKQGSSLWGTIKVLFIILTVVKAAYIVMSFMHMGDEHRLLKITILWVYAVFIFYMIILILIEGAALYPRMYNFPW